MAKLLLTRDEYETNIVKIEELLEESHPTLKFNREEFERNAKFLKIPGEGDSVLLDFIDHEDATNLWNMSNVLFMCYEMS